MQMYFLCSLIVKCQIYLGSDKGIKVMTGSKQIS